VGATDLNAELVDQQVDRDGANRFRDLLEGQIGCEARQLAGFFSHANFSDVAMCV